MSHDNCSHTPQRLSEIEVRHDPLHPQPTRAGDLGLIFHFSPSDLALNRTGVMSPGQASRLWLPKVLLLIPLVLLLAMPVMLRVALVWSGPLSGTSLAALVTKSLIIMEMLLAFLLIPPGLDALRAIGDVRDGRVEVDQGYVVPGQGKRPRYITKRRSYRVSIAATKALDKRSVHRIYFAPRTKKILAIEPLGRT